MAKTSTKPDDLSVRAYADRLILETLTELHEVVKPSEIAERLADSGIGLSAVRSLLASSPEKYAYNERRWVPAARLIGHGRPLHFAARVILERFGGPMPLRLLALELSRSRNLSEASTLRTLKRMAQTDDAFFVTTRDEVALSDWVFKSHDETIDRAMNLNGVKLEQVQELTAKLGEFDWNAPDFVRRSIEALGQANVKVLGAVAWMSLNPQDPRAPLLYDWRSFNGELLGLTGYVYTSDGNIQTEDRARKTITLAVRMAERLEPTVEIEEATPIDVKPEDVERMVERILGASQTVTATRMLEDMFEITPSVRTFPDDLNNVLDALRRDERVWWVGGDRFRAPNSAPDFIYSMPEPFDFPRTDARNEEGELVDVELSDEGLSSSLRKLLAHPLATDVNDEEIQPAPKTMPESLRLVLKPIHRELGTFPMCQVPTNWLSPEPGIQELMFIDPDGRELQVWANHDARLLFNLLDWWLDQPVESGAVFAITKTNKLNVFDFEWLDQTDPIVYVSSQRMEELREIADRAEDMSTFDILREIMGHWPKGADFLTVLWEVNVVRRTSRRLVASLLSSYLCFYQRSGSPVWHYDAKKVEQGFDKTKRKFVVRREDGD